MTLIELLMALTMLTFGMAGTIILISTAIASNGRSKADTGGTFLAQLVIDELSAVPAHQNISVPITDCSGNTTSLNTTGSATGTGATLDSSGTIDYTQNFTAVATGYRMTYIGCGPDDARPTYEVRVHVRNLTTIGSTTYTKLIVVSARRMGATTATSLRFFSPPVTLRTITGT